MVHCAGKERSLRSSNLSFYCATLQGHRALAGRDFEGFAAFSNWHHLFLHRFMNYREYIKHIFSLAQAELKEYTILCMRAHSGHDFTEELLKECDEKFREYNRLLSLHHHLLKKVTRKQIKLDEAVSASYQ